MSSRATSSTLIPIILVRGSPWTPQSAPEVRVGGHARIFGYQNRDGPGGVLHAKAVVADDEVVFVTSANLTEAALDRNIEVGLLVRDHALAATLLSNFQGLIDRRLLRPLPME